MSGQVLDDRMAAILSGRIAPTLARLTLPVLGVILAQTFVAVLEAFWVSKLGTDAVAGVSLVLPLFILMGTMSNGGIGGGVSSAVARALGAGRVADAQALVLHAVVVGLAFGLAFTLAAVIGGPLVYRALGGNGPVLQNALTYSAWVFGGAPVIWVVNLLASAMRGAGGVRLPALVSISGAVVLVPLSPVLIFGAGPFPALGLAGAGVATLAFYVAALAVYVRHLWRGGGSLRLRPSPLRRRLLADILGVGLVSAAGTLVASLTAVALTGAVGLRGAAALAGYGIASRVDSLLVPLLFGLGSGVITMVGAAVGAGDHDRMKRVVLRAGIIAFAGAELVGVVVAIAPDLWMSLFSADSAVRQVGSDYFRVAGPFYGFVGLGLLLYFAGQGRSRMGWPMAAGALRFLATAGGGLFAASSGASLPVVFSTVAAGSVLFGAINVIGWRRGRQTASAMPAKTVVSTAILANSLGRTNT